MPSGVPSQREGALEGGIRLLPASDESGCDETLHISFPQPHYISMSSVVPIRPERATPMHLQG